MTAFPDMLLPLATLPPLVLKRIELRAMLARAGTAIDEEAEEGDGAWGCRNFTAASTARAARRNFLIASETTTVEVTRDDGGDDESNEGGGQRRSKAAKARPAQAPSQKRWKREARGDSRLPPSAAVLPWFDSSCLRDTSQTRNAQAWAAATRAWGEMARSSSGIDDVHLLLLLTLLLFVVIVTMSAEKRAHSQAVIASSSVVIVMVGRVLLLLLASPLPLLPGSLHDTLLLLDCSPLPCIEAAR